MSAIYNGLKFNTALEAQWAAFFDLAKWLWWVNPVAVDNWQPQFKVAFECGHSECGPEHTLLISVLPASDLKAFNGHPCLDHYFGAKNEKGVWFADGGAAFGSSPSVTQWQISHGAGGGIEDIYFRVPNADVLWSEAQSLIKVS